ncbi:hypothetical protein Leryth_020292 [Lithospermum erythrorhizon]|nr:hypothetical protein Leryth_020292 [Lithospermum erythrorhizon]
MPSWSKTLPLLVAMVTITVVIVEAQQTAECASKLTPCSQFLNSTNPPKACCDSLKDAITNDRPCLCNLYSSGLLDSIGINVTQALQLPQRCGIANAGDLGACGNNTSGTPPSNTPSPGTRAPPSGASRESWTGIMSVLLLLYASVMVF